jgi:NH3-dependent NAD+ synthetase
VKYDSLISRLVAKMRLSKTPVPGFIIGLSGTDSIVAFMILYHAAMELGIPHRVRGIHYIGANRRSPSWFDQHVMPWLREQCPHAQLETIVPLGGNQDQQRWGDIHLRALNEVADGDIKPFPNGENYWVASATNATEKLLGKYSILSTSVSIEPIATMYKSEVMATCQYLGVPDVAMGMSRIPDCACGRDELAAENIELIDDILKYSPIDSEKYSPDLVVAITNYIRDLRQTDDFKQRIPYRI